MERLGGGRTSLLRAAILWQEVPFLSVTFEGPKVVAALSWWHRKATSIGVVAAARVRGHVANCVSGVANCQPLYALFLFVVDNGKVM